MFQHTAARRRLREIGNEFWFWGKFQHTAARRRLRQIVKMHLQLDDVSTHSRTEAAAYIIIVK